MANDKHTATQSQFSRLTRVMAAFTASLFLVSSQLALPAQANELARAQHRDMNRQEWRQFRQDNRVQLRTPASVQAPTTGTVQITPGSIPNPSLNALSIDRHQIKIERRENRQALRGDANDRAVNKAQRAGVRAERVQAHQAHVNAVRADRLSSFVIQENAGQIIRLDNGANLDLTASNSDITIGDKLIADGGFVTIKVGGETKNVYAGSKVTAAEYVAVKQAISGSQTLVVDGSGKATGGTVDLNTIAATKNTMKASSLTVGSGVTAVGDLDKHSTFKLEGDLNNFGSIYAVNTKGNNRGSADISANNITNNDGALISSNAGSQFGNKASTIDLSLNAANDFKNSGTITSSGDLSISGGNSVSNSGSVSANNNVNVNSASIKNSGSVASTYGDITLDSPVGTAMNVDNAGGTLAAHNGAINVRSANYAGSEGSNVTGGDLLSKDLNLHSGQGMVEVHVKDLTGTVHETGNGAHVSADTENLVLGTICLTGDPTFYNTGSITLNGNITVGEALAILAEGDITGTAALGSITARSAGDVGQNIFLVAGFDLTSAGTTSPTVGPFPGTGTILTAGQTVTANDAGSLGGDINLTASNVQILANGLNPNLFAGKNGGNVSLIARANGSTGGHVLLSAGSLIDTRGIQATIVGGATNGNVTIIAGNNDAGNAISVGQINAAGGGGTTGGAVTIRAAQPSAGAGTTFNNVGNISAGGFTFGATSTTAGVLLGNNITGRGDILINAGSTGISTGGANVTVSALNTNATLGTTGAVTTSGGNLNVNAANNVNVTATGINSQSALNGGSVTLLADSDDNGSGDLNAAGVAINTSGAGAGGTGGAINLDNGENNGEVLSVGALTSAGSGGGAGGNINIGVTNDSAGDVTISGAVNAGTGTFTIDGDDNDHTVNLGGDVTASAISIDLDTGNITGPGAGITLTTNGYTVTAGTFSVGTGAVVIQEQTAGTTIGVAGGGGTLNISSGELTDFIAGSLTIGSATAGTITVGGAINLSGTPGTTNGAYDLTFLTNNNFAGAANNVTLGAQDLVITATNAVTYGNITGGTGAAIIDISSNTGSVTLGNLSNTNGLIDVDAQTNVTIGTITTVDGIVDIDAITGSATIAAINKSGINDIFVDASTDITITGATTATSGNVFYTSGTGFIQTGAITTTTGTIDLDSTTGTSITTGALQTNGGNIDVDSGTSTTIASINAITGGTIDIDAGTDVAITGDVTGTATSLTIDNTNGFIQTGNITTNGVVDLGGIGTTAIQILAVNATAGAISLESTGSVQAASLSTTSTVDVDAGTDIIIAGATSADAGVNMASVLGFINVGNITTVAGNIVLTTTPGGTSILAGALQTNGGSVDIDSATSTFLTSIAMLGGGTIDIDSGTFTTITGDITGSATSVTIDSVNGGVSLANVTTNNGLIDITSTNDAVTTGDLIAGSGNVDLDAGTDTITGNIVNTGAITIDSGDDTSIVGISNAVGQIDITSANDTTITGFLSGGAGNVTINSTTGSTTTDDIAVTTGNLSITSNINTTTADLSSTDGDIVISSTTGNTSVDSVFQTGTGQFIVTSGGTTTVGGPVVTNGNVVIASTGDINLGTTTTTADIFLYSGANINTSGTLTADPIVMTAANDINLGGSLVADGGITVVAGHDVMNVAPISINGSGATNGGNVVVVAGADYVVNVLTSVTINGASATGGSILFNNLGGVSAITTTGAAGTGGDVTLVAFQNSFSGGQILMPLTSNITTTGSGANQSGDVSVVAGSLVGTAMQLGNITTSTATNGLNGNVVLQAATPTSGSVIANNATYSGTFLGGTNLAADIRTSNITARGAFVIINSDQNVGVGNINVSGQATQSGGTVIIGANGTDRFDIGLVAGSNFAASIQANGGTTSGDGGSILVVNQGTTGIRTNPLSINVTDGDGGFLTLDADQGNLQLNAGTYAVNGAGTNQNAGVLTLVADSITVSGGSATLASNATGIGAGGLISVETLTGGLTLGTNAGQLAISSSGVGNVVSIGTGGNLTVSATGGFSANVVNLATTNPGSNLTFNGAVTATNTLNLDSAGAILINAAVAGNLAVNATAFGNITGTAVLTGPTMNLTSTTGNIGSSPASRLQIQATDLVANAAGGSVFVGDVDTLNIGPGSSLAAFIFDAQAAGNLTNSGTIAAVDVVLRSVGGTVTLGALVTGTNSVTLRSGTDLLDGGISNVVSNLINLISDNGDIGTLLNPFNIDAVNLTVNAANGDAFIIDPNSINISGPSNAGGLLSIIANTNLTSSPGGAISGLDVALESTTGQLFLDGDVSATNSIGLTQALTFTNANFTNLFAPQIDITSTAGSIGISPASRLVLDANNITLNAANNVYFSDPNSVNIGVPGTSSAGLVFDVLAGGDLIVRNDITAGSITLAGDNISLRADVTATVGTILSANNNIDQIIGTVVTPLLDIEANGSVIIGSTNNGGGGQIVQFTGTGDFQLTTQETGGVTLAQSTANSIVLDASASDVDTLGNTTVTQTLDITVDSAFTNEFDLTADTINIQSATNPLTFNGGTGTGSLTATGAGGINVEAASGNLTFTGDQDLFGAAFFTVQPFNDIIISLGANIIGADAVTLNTCNLQLIGNLVGNPIIFNCPLGAGTIANSTGDVNLSSDIIFNGLDLAIIASGSITSTGLTTIDLSDTADGGNLTMIAGFDFTPATAGQVQNSILYTIGSNSTTGGLINLAGVTINTSSTTAGDGGNILAVASSGTVGDGSITLGPISTTAVVGTGGTVEVLGAGDLTLGSVDATGSVASGNVNLTVSQPQRVGPVFIGNGERFGAGAFVPTTLLGGADIFVNSILAEDVNFGGADSVTTTANITATGDVNLNTRLLNNTFTISGDNVSVTGLAGFDLTIDGSAAAGGTLTANSGTVTIGAPGGDVRFFGAQTFNGTTQITPGGPGFSVIVANAANVLGTNDVFLNTCSLILQGNGVINGNLLHFNCPNGAGTIANASGDVDLTGINLVFDGQALAILASGNIIAGSTTLIDLSSSTGTGGNLLAVAGFDFTPGTGGVQVGPDDVVYTLAQGGGNAGGGNIDFSTLNIITNGIAAGNGGDVTLVASGGNVNSGTVVFNNITNTGGISGNDGNVLVIAEGGFTQLGTITNPGGTVTLAAATPTIVGGDILVGNGENLGPGTFSFGPPTAAGTIANSNGNVDLTGLNLTFVGLNLSIIASGDVIAGTNTSINLSNPAGNGGTLLVVAGFDFTPATAGQVNFNSSTTYTLTPGGSASGGDIDFTGLTITTSATGGNAGDVTLVAKAGGTNNGSIITGNINAVGSGGGNGGDILVIAEGGFLISGIANTGAVNGTTQLAAATPLITGGAITVNNGTQGGPGAFTFTAPTGAGTIANSSGDVNISGALSFTGLSLAILAQGSINAASGTSINLGDASGIGGNLTMIAGFDFTPATVGQVIDTTQIFTITGGVGGIGGNINLAGTNITTSGLNGAGNVLAVAFSSSAGQITIGNIAASSGSGAAGDVTLIGESGVTVGAIVNTGTVGTGDVNIAISEPLIVGTVTVQNGNLLSGGFTSGTLTPGTISVASIDAGNNVNLAANTGAGVGMAVNAISAGNDINVINTGSITIAGNLLSDLGAINITANDVAGQATLLTINPAVDITAFTEVNIINTGTDRKLDKFNIGAGANIATTNKAALGDINLRLGAVSESATEQQASEIEILVTETGGTLTLFGGKPKGSKPVNNITALGANVNITNTLRGKAFNFLGSVTVTADPPVAAGTPTYVNGRLVGGDNERGSRSGHAEVAIAELTAALNSNLVSGNAFDQKSETLLSTTVTGTDTLGNAGNSLIASANGTVGTTGTTTSRTETLVGGVSQVAQEDNSYMVSSSTGPVKEAEASICTDADLGTAGNANHIAHNDRVVLKQGNVLFVPFRNTVVETPQGNVVIEAKSVALVSVTNDKLAVYDIDDSHKGAVTIEAHGQKLTLAPGSHLTVASAKSGEFAQVNAIEAIPHRNVATKVIGNGVKLHTSEFSVASAMQSVKSLQAVMGSKHPQAKKVADRMMKTTAVLLTLGGKGEFQHFFKPALTAMK